MCESRTPRCIPTGVRTSKTPSTIFADTVLVRRADSMIWTGRSTPVICSRGSGWLMESVLVYRMSEAWADASDASLTRSTRSPIVMSPDESTFSQSAPRFEIRPRLPPWRSSNM